MSDDPLPSFAHARMEEIEMTNRSLRVDLSSAEAREGALHRSISGYKRLVEDLTEKRNSAAQDADRLRKIVDGLTDKARALLTENEHLRGQLRKLEQVTTVSRESAELTASSAFSRIASQMPNTNAVPTASWLSDPTAVLAKVTELESDVSTLREQLRCRTTNLQEAYSVIHNLTTSASAAAAADAILSQLSVAHPLYCVLSRNSALNDGQDGGRVAAVSNGRIMSMAAEKAELQVRVLELEQQVATLRSLRSTSTQSVKTSISAGGGYTNNFTSAGFPQLQRR